MSGLRPIRRVVTGNDDKGRSRVVWDSAAPNVHQASMGVGRGHTNLWIWNETPLPLTGESDAGDLPYDFPGPVHGGHFRVVQSIGRPANYDPARDQDVVPTHPPKLRLPSRTWDRGGNNAYSSSMHKTETVDYGILLFGERRLRLDDREVIVRQGDIVVQVGSWHQWSSPQEGGIMAFDMIGARFVDGDAGLMQGNDKPITTPPDFKLPEGVRPARRIVTIDREPNRSCVVSDGPSPDVITDPARPGFASTRLWVAESAPAPIVAESLHLPHRMQPPAGGSVLRVDTIPPDEAWKSKVKGDDVAAFFRAMGAPGAPIRSGSTPHAYMQKLRTFDFCCVLEGEPVLVLDAQEVALAVGDVVILRGVSHAWSNRSTQPAVIAIASHDAV